MDTSLWVVLVAPAATLLAVIIERSFSLKLVSQQQQVTSAKEKRDYAVQLLNDELGPIREFADKAGTVAVDIQDHYRLVAGAIARQATETEVVTLMDGISSNYNEVRRLGDVAQVRACALSEDLIQAVEMILNTFIAANKSLSAYLSKVLTGEEDPSRDEVNARMGRLQAECGHLRRLCLEYQIRVFDKGALAAREPQ